MRDILESTIGNEAVKILEGDYDLGWSDTLTVNTITDVFIGMAKFLGKKKSKDKPVVVEIRDMNGKFHFAGYVSFLAQSESGSDEGSWALNYTFDESDLEPEWDRYDLLSTPEAFATFHDVTYLSHGISWRFVPAETNEVTEGTPLFIIPILMDLLKRYMEANVTVNPELSISERAYLKAEMGSTGVHISITPNATLKSYIKDDQMMNIIG
jgi:hypothetical protein